MDRESIYAFVSEVVENENGEVTSEDMLVSETGIDSFSTAVLYLELDDEYGCFNPEYDHTGDKPLKDFTIKDIIEAVLNKDK